jgi:copper chaperone CopZ
MDNTTITLPLLDVNSPHCAMRVEKAIRTVPAHHRPLMWTSMPMWHTSPAASQRRP